MLTLTLFCCSFVSAEPETKEKASPANEEPKAIADSKKSDHLKTPDAPESETLMLFYEQGEKVSFWIQGQKGNLSVVKSEALWFDQGLISPAGKGYLYYLGEGASFYATEKPKSSVPLSQALKNAQESPKGYSWEVTQRKGQYLPMLTTPNGAKVRLKMSKAQPSKPMWLKTQTPPSKGVSAPTIRKSSWGNGDLPTNAQPIKSLKTPDSTSWEKDLSAIRNGSSTIKYSSMVDLDGDKEEEALICVKGGRGYPCYIYDNVNGEKRYYALSSVSPDSASKSASFTLDGKTYIAHKKQTKKSALQQLIRFDGHKYILETVR